jgi:hypothetical protein
MQYRMVNTSSDGCRRVAVPLRGLVIRDTFPDGSLVALDGQWPNSYCILYVRSSSRSYSDLGRLASFLVAEKLQQQALSILAFHEHLKHSDTFSVRDRT